MEFHYLLCKTYLRHETIYIILRISKSSAVKKEKPCDMTLRLSLTREFSYGNYYPRKSKVDFFACWLWKTHLSNLDYVAMKNTASMSKEVIFIYHFHTHNIFSSFMSG